MASRKGLSLFFILLAWLPTGRTVAQNAPHFSHLTREEGLSQSTVFDVLQDRTGFMWIATQDGLNQFDGYRFRIFKHNPRAPNSLGDSFVRALTLDAAGRLWMTTNNRGLNLWIPEEQSFRHFTHDPADPTSISSNSTMCCLSDSAGNLWVGTFDSGLNLLRWDAESGPAAFRRFQHDSLSEGSISGNNISALFSDRSGMLWVGTYDSGLNRLDPAAPEKGFQRFRHRPGDRQSLSDDNITSISADEDGYLWIGTRGGGINRFDPATGIFRHFRPREGEDSGLLNDNVRAIFYEGKTENRRIYWVGTWGSGLHQMIFEDPEGEPLWRNFHHQADDRNSLSDDFIFKIFRDRSNTLWITTNRAGINLKVPFTERFRHYRSESDNPGSLSANGIWSFLV